MVSKVKDIIRVLVVDDSPSASDLLVSILQSVEGIEVIGVGRDGHDAVRLAKRLKPDVITMDIVMPNMDGMEATMQIMTENPTPIVIVSATLTKVDIVPTFNAIMHGALSMVKKPGLNDPEGCAEIIKTVRLMSQVPTVRHWNPNKTKQKPKPKPKKEQSVETATEKKISRGVKLLEQDNLKAIQMIGIVSSTGGPGILAEILKQLPADFSVPIMIVQHITEGFAAGFADWLNTETELFVGIAGHGDKPRPGAALVAPDNYHMRLDSRGTIELMKRTSEKGICPSGNFLIQSLAESFGYRALGIILTGMGSDGAEGLLSLHNAGGLTFAQEEHSCVVYGMPNEAVKANAVDYIFTPQQIGVALNELNETKNLVLAQ